MQPRDNLIACPTCDALYQRTKPSVGERTVCGRCHTVLESPREGRSRQIVALSLTVAILMTGVLFLPFLRLQIQGLSNDVSILDAAFVFTDGESLPLVLGVVLMIILLPMLRVGLLLYVTLPLALGGRAWRGAAMAYRWSEGIKPWAMAEIFIIGCAIALVKVVDLAEVVFGPAFFMFIALVIVSVFKDGMLSKWSVWRTLEQTA